MVSFIFVYSVVNIHIIGPMQPLHLTEVIIKVMVRPVTCRGDWGALGHGQQWDKCDYGTSLLHMLTYLCYFERRGLCKHKYVVVDIKFRSCNNLC